MKVLVVGGGGREHAIVQKLRQSPRVSQLYALPGNGGMASDATLVPIGAKDIDAMVAFAREKGIDFVVVAPDDPLALGAVDALKQAGIACFGPDKKAAEIESSKVFAKRLMKKYGIPTAAFEVFDDEAQALAYLDTAPIPTVIKADGLALGKGVTLAYTREEAQAAVHAMMGERVFGESGARILIEEMLEGPEVSVLAFADGKTVVPMVSAMDHKRALDGDLGPNTGGMGVVAPNPFYTPEVASQCMDTIFRPTIEAMAAEGRPFPGCLYFGLMLTRPPLLAGGLLVIMGPPPEGRLADVPVRFSDRACCCVVLASQGYPGKYQTGFPLLLPAPRKDVSVFVAGAKLEGGRLVTSGGRVVGVSALADTLGEAVDLAYRAAQDVAFDNKYCRKDIGARALAATKGGATPW